MCENGIFEYDEPTRVCPKCGRACDYVTTEFDSGSAILFGLGIVLTPVIIGVFLIIAAMQRGPHRIVEPYYKCPACGWNDKPSGTSNKTGSRAAIPRDLRVWIIVGCVVVVSACLVIIIGMCLTGGDPYYSM